jgi:hypothetical protein
MRESDVKSHVEGKKRFVYSRRHTHFIAINGHYLVTKKSSDDSIKGNTYMAQCPHDYSSDPPLHPGCRLSI